MTHPQRCIRRGYTEFVDALERAEEECRQCGIAAAMAAGTTLGQSALQAGGSDLGSGDVSLQDGIETGFQCDFNAIE